MTGEELEYVLALTRRRRLSDRDDTDHWHRSDATAGVRAARRALVDLGYSREHMRHLEEVALSSDELIERFGKPLSGAGLKRAAVEVRKQVKGVLDERKRGPIERLRDDLDEWSAGGS